MSFDDEAYLIDFTDPHGNTFAMKTIAAEHLLRLIHEPTLAYAQSSTPKSITLLPQQREKGTKQDDLHPTAAGNRLTQHQRVGINVGNASRTRSLASKHVAIAVSTSIKM
jgi:hypothetical protein